MSYKNCKFGGVVGGRRGERSGDAVDGGCSRRGDEVDWVDWVDRVGGVEIDFIFLEAVGMKALAA